MTIAPHHRPHRLHRQLQICTVIQLCGSLLTVVSVVVLGIVVGRYAERFDSFGHNLLSLKAKVDATKAVVDQVQTQVEVVRTEQRALDHRVGRMERVLDARGGGP